MKILATALLLSISVVCIGCATDQAARYYASEKYSAVPAEQVQILREAPDREFEVIADFQARGASFESMRRKAAAVGADAVIIVPLGGYRSTTDEWADDKSHGSYYSRLTASAIRYRR
jgi:hypothetical protein